MWKWPDSVDPELQILQDFFPHTKNNKGHLVPHVNSNVPVLKILKLSKSQNHIQVNIPIQSEFQSYEHKGSNHHKGGLRQELPLAQEALQSRLRGEVRSLGRGKA